MITLRKLSLYATVGVFALGLAACSKKNDQLETDYASKKASAQTLIDQIDKTAPNMMNDHNQWMSALDQAATKPGADTAKINSLRNDMKQHMADGQAIHALEDSVKAYMNATPDQGDAFKNADDRLGANFNDLNDKWKSFQDKHNSLQQSIQQFAVNTAGNAVTDTAKANKPAAEAPKKETKKTMEKKGTSNAAPAPVPPSQKHEEHGMPRHPAH